MPPPLPPELAPLAAEHEALARAPDPARRRALVAAIERTVPEAGAERLLALSLLVAASGEPRHLAALHETVWRGEAFTLEQRYYCYWQLITRHAHVQGPGVPDPAAVYRALVAAWRRAAGAPAGWIPPGARDPAGAIVITTQLLGPRHAPTADCLDYCRLLQGRLGRRVLLVNAASMPWTEPVPYYDAIRFNYEAAYSKGGRVSTGGEAIEFYQCRAPMPNLEETRAILHTVRTRRPALVLSLGHSNIAADLCADLVTVATMPFGTNLPRTASNVVILPRRRRPDDEAAMRQWGIEAERIVETEYTFPPPVVRAPVTRAELGVPEDAYVLAVVGNRLDEELTDGVADELARLLDGCPRAFLVLAGTFAGFARFSSRAPALEARARFLGYRDDVPAVYACCDAYLNPPRYGGGSSAAFALGMGVPVLTLPTGDVANIAGARFVFASFDAIRAFVSRAAGDAAERAAWSAAARARFGEISDREGMLRRLLGDVAAKADLRRC